MLNFKARLLAEQTPISLICAPSESDITAKIANKKGYTQVATWK
jgi:hypothetical protein